MAGAEKAWEVVRDQESTDPRNEGGRPPEAKKEKEEQKQRQCLKLKGWGVVEDPCPSKHPRGAACSLPTKFFRLCQSTTL